MLSKVCMFGIILISVLVLGQSTVELSEIQTNPIQTMINFDGYQTNKDQTQQQQEYFNFDDDTLISSNKNVIENNKSIEDPNNFILDYQNVSTLNSQVTSILTNENYIQDVNDIPKLDMIDTQSTQTFSQQNQDSNTISNTQQKTLNSNCIIIYSQCNFKGESQELCESQKNIENFDHDIKSIEIPKGYSVRLYNKEDYLGEKIILNESQECLIKPLVLTQLQQKQLNKFTILVQNLNLRQI